ncbi:hypothetical protein HMPREF0379_1601, partial [[Eubacterium] yurii subsp. margaretiae ATCC 43715]
WYYLFFHIQCSHYITRMKYNQFNRILQIFSIKNSLYSALYCYKEFF